MASGAHSPVGKPWGIWFTHAGIPLGASFAVLFDPSDDEVAWARAFAAGRYAAGHPFAWVLYLSREDRAIAWVPRVRQRLEALLPYVPAICYGEEWYRGLGSIAEIDAKCAWVGQQHAVLKEYFPSQAIVSVNAFTCPATEFGPTYYSPEPAHVDLRGVYTYVPRGHTWDSCLLEHKLRLACGYRVGAYQLPQKPVVLITQAFQYDGDPQWQDWPTATTTAHAARWARDPAVLAVWPFDYASRAWVPGFRGWADWPERHGLAALGVQ